MENQTFCSPLKNISLQNSSKQCFSSFAKFAAMAETSNRPSLTASWCMGAFLILVSEVSLKRKNKIYILFQ